MSDKAHFHGFQERLEKICKERGISVDVGFAAFRDFIELLGETQYKGGFGAQSDRTGLINQVYWVLGDETACHIAGLFRQYDQGAAFEELKYTGTNFKKYKATYERWVAELEENNEAEE